MVVKALGTGLVALSLTLAGTAFAADAESREAESHKKLCKSLGKLDKSLEKLEKISKNSSIKDLRYSEEDVGKEFGNVQKYAAQVEDVNGDSLASSYSALHKAVNDIPGTATIQEGKDAIKEQITDVRDDQSRMSKDAKCEAEKKK